MNARTGLAPIRRQPRLRWALPVVVVCLALVGCGGGGTASSSPSASSPSSATQSAGLSAFQTCLKQHGVKITPRARGSFSPGASFSPRAFPSGSGFPTAFPSGGFGGGFGGGGTGANSAAFKACQKYAPAGFRTGGYTHPRTGDRLHAHEVDYTVTADYYKGVPGSGYISHVFTDALSAEHLVAMRDWLEQDVRQALSIPFNQSRSALRYEHSMGQGLPEFVFRSTKGGAGTQLDSAA